jgi:phage shock protein C
MNENGKRLTRTRQSRMIAGVCSGMADYFGIDATIVRIVLIAVTLLTGGTGILLYVAAVLVVPDEGKETSIAQDLINKQTHKSNSDLS